jgi:hypothetical protein
VQALHYPFSIKKSTSDSLLSAELALQHSFAVVDEFNKAIVLLLLNSFKLLSACLESRSAPLFLAVSAGQANQLLCAELAA